MKVFRWVAIVWVSMLMFPVRPAVGGESAAFGHERFLQKLIDGNKRYVGAKLSHPNQTPERRAKVAEGQHPLAVIVSCSDSRVPPELVFDQGVGDLFVVRLAGNVVDDVALGSIEYAVEHLDVPLIVVLGHERCGAVEAAVKGGEAHGHIKSVVDGIKPAIEIAKGQPGDLAENVMRANVRMVVQHLESAKPILEELVKKGVLHIVGARYDLDDGLVTLVP